MLLLVCAGIPGVAIAQDAKTEPNNGTDPTRLSSSAALVYEYNDIAPDFARQALRVDLTLPFGAKSDYSVRLRVPVVSFDVAGDDDFDLGDVQVQLTHVFGLTRQRGLVARGELVLDTAQRSELGTGKHVFKGTFIHAHFLPHGIFAPAVAHSIDVGGDDDRADVNSTIFDFYYVPKLADPRTFVTLDPALTLDWENDKEFASFAATLGRSVGPALAGVAQVFVKPSVFAGSDRPGDWALEVGLKVLGF